MRKFYSVFDRKRNRIGLAYARHDPARAEVAAAEAVQKELERIAISDTDTALSLLNQQQRPRKGSPGRRRIGRP